MFRKCLATFFLHGNSKVVANYHDFLLKVFIVEDGRQAFGLQPFDSSAFWLWWKQRSGTLLPLNFQALRLSEEKLPMQCDGDTGLDTSQKSDWRKFACEVLDQNKWCLGTRGVASHLRASATPCLSLLDTILLLGNTWRGCYLPVVLLSVPVFLPICGAKSISGWFQSTMPSSDVLFVQFCFHHQEDERERQPSVGWNVGFGSPLHYDEANSASWGQACAMPSCSNGSVWAGDGKYKTSVLLRWLFISFFFPVIWDEPTPAWWELSFLYEVSTPARQSIQTWPSSSHPHCVGIFSMLWAASVGSDVLGTVS